MVPIIEALKKSAISPNLDTFAYILSCLGHHENGDFVAEQAKSILEWMQQQVRKPNSLSFAFYILLFLLMMLQ